MGRIAIGQDMVQFSCKLEASLDLWDTRAGRVNGKSAHARKVNSEIDKINVAVNAKYREIVALRGKATANEIKNAFQCTALSQKTVLQIFREHNEAFEKRIGVNRTNGTYLNYKSSYLCLERFIRKQYHVTDIAFRQLDYFFIENYDFYMRIDCKYMANTALQKTMHLRKMVNIAVRRKIINHDPFVGYCQRQTHRRCSPHRRMGKCSIADRKRRIVPSHFPKRHRNIHPPNNTIYFCILYQIYYLCLFNFFIMSLALKIEVKECIISQG